MLYDYDLIKILIWPSLADLVPSHTEFDTIRERRSQANFQFAQAQFFVDYIANKACNRKVVNILKISEFVVTLHNKRLK